MLQDPPSSIIDKSEGPRNISDKRVIFKCECFPLDLKTGSAPLINPQ